MKIRQRLRMNPLVLVLLLSAIFFAVFLALSGTVYFSQFSGKDKASVTRSLFSRDAVGVIELEGVIMESKKILRKLEKFKEDPNIKAIVLRLNSPGGAVAPSQEIYEAVKDFNKPVVVSMSSVAASGAYYISCGAKKVFANPGTITGSIGVIMEFANLEKLYEWAKIKRFAIKTGKFKDVGAEYKEMSPEGRALLQAMVDDVLAQFKKAVSEGRKLSMEEVTAVADGRIFSGNQAKTAKLVDELGTFQDAIDEAGRMGGIQGKPRVVYPEKSRRVLDLLIDDGPSDEDSEARIGKFDFLSGLVSKVLGFSTSNSAAPRDPGIYWLWNGAL